MEESEKVLRRMDLEEKAGQDEICGAKHNLVEAMQGILGRVGVDSGFLEVRH
jgi:hypothetical protein